MSRLSIYIEKGSKWTGRPLAPDAADPLCDATHRFPGIQSIQGSSRSASCHLDCRTAAARAACVCSVTVYNNDVVEKLIYDDAKHLTPAGGCRASQCCTNYITQTLLSPRRRHRVRNQADHVKPSLADVSPCRIGSNRYPDRWLRKGMLEAVQQVKTTI